jgi:hypothetical protein
MKGTLTRSATFLSLKACAQFLQQLTSLTHLELGGCFSEFGGDMPMGQSPLTQLRSLDIQVAFLMPLHPEAVQGLSGMTQLSSFCLSVPALCVMSADQSTGEQPVTAVPGLTVLTQLQVLKLTSTGGCRGRLQPSLLSSFTNLQHLALEFPSLVPFGTGMQDVLSLLPQLQHLTALELHVDRLEAASHTALTALTANSRLKLLNLYRTKLPRETWLQVFAPNTVGNRLSQLEGLSLMCSIDPEPALEYSDLERIAHCCPNLRSLSFELQRGVTVEPQPLLTGFTKLRISCTRVQWTMTSCVRWGSG